MRAGRVQDGVRACQFITDTGTKSAFSRTPHVMDTLLFSDDLVTVALPDPALSAIVEQGCSLEAGMVQVSGLRASYDPRRPAGARVIDLQVGGAPLKPERRYLVATNSCLAEGGDSYVTFGDGTLVCRFGVLHEELMENVRNQAQVLEPAMQRIVRVYCGIYEIMNTSGSARNAPRPQLGHRTPSSCHVFTSLSPLHVGYTARGIAESLVDSVPHVRQSTGVST